MKQNFNIFHPNISTQDYIRDKLKNSDRDKELISSNHYVLKDWIFKCDDICSIKFTMNVKWTEPIQQVFNTDKLEIHEKRKFELENAQCTITSTFSTNYSFLHAKVIRTLTDKNNGCSEVISAMVFYTGGVYKSQIEDDFFRALKPLLIDEAENGSTAMKRDKFSIEHLQAYHDLHDDLEELKKCSKALNDIVEKAKIVRKPLEVPSRDQISQTTDLVSYEKFSIQNEINLMNAEADRTFRIVGSIEKAREQILGTNSLPLLIMASCAAVIAIVISRSKK